MPHDVWVDENGYYPDLCTCRHPWIAHQSAASHRCDHCNCDRYVEGGE